MHTTDAITPQGTAAYVLQRPAHQPPNGFEARSFPWLSAALQALLDHSMHLIQPERPVQATHPARFGELEVRSPHHDHRFVLNLEDDVWLGAYPRYFIKIGVQSDMPMSQLQQEVRLDPAVFHPSYQHPVFIPLLSLDDNSTRQPFHDIINSLYLSLHLDQQLRGQHTLHPRIIRPAEGHQYLGL
jgi:hypothetical protein